VGIRAGDLLDEAVLRERVRRLLLEKPNSTREAGWDTEERALEDLRRMGEILRPYIADPGSLLREALSAGASASSLRGPRPPFWTSTTAPTPT
jgi:adenylosuccinate synthase